MQRRALCRIDFSLFALLRAARIHMTKSRPNSQPLRLENPVLSYRDTIAHAI